MGGYSTRGERSRSSTHNDGAVIPPPRRYLARPPRSGPVLPAPEPARPFVVSCFCCRAATRPQIRKQPPVCRVSSSLRTEAPCESITLRRSNTLQEKIFASGTYTLRRCDAHKRSQATRSQRLDPRRLERVSLGAREKNTTQPKKKWKVCGAAESSGSTADLGQEFSLFVQKVKPRGRSPAGETSESRSVFPLPESQTSSSSSSTSSSSSSYF